MPVDYPYCKSDSCIHRRGCRRWIHNYTICVYIENWVDEVECRNENGEEENDGYAPGFIHLDRFRYSDGSAMPDGKK